MLPIAIVAAALQPTWMRSTIWLPLIFFVGASTPFIVTGRTLHQRPSPRALGAATGLAWVTMITIPAVTMLGETIRRAWLRGGSGTFSFLMGGWTGAWRLLQNVMPRTGYVLLVVLFGATAALSTYAWRARGSLGGSPKKGWWKGLLLSVAYALVAIPGFYLLAEGQSEREYAKRSAREALYRQTGVDVRKMLRRAQSCLYVYESAHPNEGFPKGLDALGLHGAGCFDSSAVGALIAATRIRYAAELPDSSGRVNGFWLVAEPMTENATWRQEYYADETGLVYRGDLRNRDDSMTFHHKLPDSSLPPPRELLEVVDSPVSKLITLRDCLAKYSGETPPEYPRSLTLHPCMRNAVDDQAVIDVDALPEGSIVGASYLLVYRSRRLLSEHTAESYTVDVRPTEYGVDGVRSYWFDELGRIHCTREYRSATANDPVVDECEVELHCGGPIPP